MRDEEQNKRSLKDYTEEMALAAFFLTVPSLCIPFVFSDLFALILAVPGVALGIAGRKSEKRTLALLSIGMGLTAIVMVLVGIFVEQVVLR